jgi:hypothetical protein
LPTAPASTVDVFPRSCATEPAYWIRPSQTPVGFLRRAIRGPVVGRKNHYGSKSRRGTQVAATLYTVLETAKLHAIDPAAYLAAAIRAAETGDVVLPWQFAAQQP